MTVAAAQPIADKNALLQRAHELFRQRDYAAAAPLYKALLSAEFGNFLVWGNLGISLRSIGSYEAAAVCLGRSLELSCGSYTVLWHYGHCLTFLNRKEESLKAFAEAFRMAPDDFNVHVFYAYALREFGCNEEALEHYNAALAMDPAHLDTIWSRADVLLRLGRFKEAWGDFEIRWKLGRNYSFHTTLEHEKTYKSQRWTGQELAGKTIVAFAEQGFGDTMLASRYMPLLKARGARVVLRVTPELARLFHGIPGVDMLVPGGPFTGHADYHVPLMSLPAIFGTELSTIPPVAMLHVPQTPPPEVERLIRLGGDRFKVGIVWSGRPTFTGNFKRATGLNRFLALAEVPGVQLYSLQKGAGEQDIAALGAEGTVIDLGPHLKDFADTAAALKNLDLVIMTDSSVAHLSGAIGCPVWNLLAYCPYWVYQLQGEDCPWYPSMRLLRQPEPGDWDSVFQKAAAELARAVALKKAGQWRWGKR